MHLLCACMCVFVYVCFCEPHNPEEKNEWNFFPVFDGMKYLRLELELFILFWFWIRTFLKIYHIIRNSSIVTRLILNDVQAYFRPEVARLWHGSFQAAE